LLITNVRQKLSSPAIKNTLWLTSEKLLSMALVLLVNIFVARHLGPESFGLLNYFLAIVALMVPLTSLGMNAIVTKEVVKTPKRQQMIINTAILFRLLGGGVACLFIWLMTSLDFLNIDNDYLMLFLLLTLINSLVAFHVVDFWFQAKVLSKYIVKVRFTVLFVLSIAKLFGVYLELSLATFIWLAILESGLLSLGFLAIYLYKSKLSILGGIDVLFGFQLLKQSKWLIFSSIASIIYLKIDQLMLAEMVSTTEVGIYAVASRMSEVWYFFPIALVSSFFPSLLKLKQSSKEQYQARLQKLCDLLFGIALIVAITIFFISDWIITMLFGDAYVASSAILMIHIWAGLFVFMRALLSKWILAEDLVVFSLVTHGVGAVINVVLNYWLIPLYQGQGAAIATVVSYAFASYIVLFFHRSTWPMAKIMTKSLFFPSRLFLAHVKSSA